jgi:hypothetical protein
VRTAASMSSHVMDATLTCSQLSRTCRMASPGSSHLSPIRMTSGMAGCSFASRRRIVMRLLPARQGCRIRPERGRARAEPPIGAVIVSDLGSRGTDWWNCRLSSWLLTI